MPMKLLFMVYDLRVSIIRIAVKLILCAYCFDFRCGYVRKITTKNSIHQRPVFISDVPEFLFLNLEIESRLYFLQVTSA